MSVWEYHPKFVNLSSYASYMFPTIEDRVRRFVQGLNPLVISETSIVSLNYNMNHGKMMAFAQSTETR